NSSSPTPGAKTSTPSRHDFPRQRPCRVHDTAATTTFLRPQLRRDLAASPSRPCRDNHTAAPATFPRQRPFCVRAAAASAFPS
ncbi:MAG: hypothetical protein MPK62_08380, partial [Alphaproteobacteria bacterium]|nr:hypothetical protein [Alphaproteobacteria bacterium]